MGELSRANVLATRQHGVIAHRQAASVGVSNDVIYGLHERGLWIPVHQGVSRIAGAPVTWRQQLKAATLAGAETVVASHKAAVELWSLAETNENPIVVTVPYACDYNARGVEVHRARKLGPIDTAVVDGIHVSSVTRLLLDMAAFWSAEQLMDAMDNAFRRGLSSPARARWHLSQIGGRGRTGTRLFRELLADYEPGARYPDSAFERHLRRALQAAGVELPVIRYIVRWEGKDLEVDAGWPAYKVCAECYGLKWHDQRRRAERDADKRGKLAAAGWLVYPLLWHKLVNTPHIVASEIRAALASRGRT